MVRKAVDLRAEAGPGGRRRRRLGLVLLAILVLAGVAQYSGCQMAPVEGQPLFNAKRFDHFTCTNLTTVVASVKWELFHDPVPGQPWKPFATYTWSQMIPGQTGGFAPGIVHEPEATGVYKVACTATLTLNPPVEVSCDLVVPDGTTARWNTARFLLAPTDEQRATRRLCGEGVLYDGRVGTSD